MKVLFTSQDYYPAISGVPIVVKYLAESLVQKGHQVAVATTQPQVTFKKCYNGVDVYSFNITYKKFRGYIGEKRKYINFILDYDCDVIINHCSQTATTDLLLPFLERIKAKKIFHSHGFSGLQVKPFDFPKGFKHTLGSWYNYFRFLKYYRFFHFFLEKYDHLLYLSEKDSAKAHLDKFGFSNFSYLYNAAEDIFTDENYLNEENPFKMHKPYLISVANYTSVKNQSELIKAYYGSKIASKHSLILIGSKETPYLKKLDKLHQTLNSKDDSRKVVFKVGIERKLIPTILKDSDLYLSSSKFEEFSLSLIETMMLGIPFISTNEGNASLLPGGYTLKPKEDMSKQLDYILANKDVYDNYSKNGKAFAIEHCTRKNVCNIFEKLLLGLVAQAND